jgi:hypothetical protein
MTNPADLEEDDTAVRYLIALGATPRRIEKAVADEERRKLARRIGCDAEDIAGLARRWGITRISAKKALLEDIRQKQAVILEQPEIRRAG